MKNNATKHLICSLSKAAFALVVTVVMFLADANAQVQTQKAVYTKVSNFIGGYYESLPVNYNNEPNKKFPILIYIHGKGELGDGSAAQLPRVLNNGPARLLNQGKFPASFNVNGEQHSFIVVSPQITTDNYGWSHNFITEFLEYCKKTYRVDEQRIYISGLSMGGGMTWWVLGKHANTYAAAVTVCGAANYRDAWGPVIVNAKLPIWSTHNSGDKVVTASVTTTWNKKLRALGANPAHKMTIFAADGHDAWSKTYDPNFKENGMNVYEWMLSHKKGGTAPVVVAQPPVANAGADKIITLPTNSISLDGSKSTASSGNITTYAWSKVAGPAAGTIAAANAATTTANNLVAGTYQFELKVTDNNNNTATAKVTVTVNDAPVAAVAPTANAGTNQNITLPANSIHLDGSKSFATNDTIVSYKWTKTYGGVATIANTAAATTTVSGLAEGNYTFTLTVTNSKQLSTSATVNVSVAAAVVDGVPVSIAGANQTISLPASSVTVNGTASKATTGRIISYSWSKVSGGAATITNPGTATTTITGLTAGVYQFSLLVISDNGKRSSSLVTITVNAAVASARTAAVAEVSYENTAAISALNATAKTEIEVYPNPVVSDLNVKISSASVGKTNIVIYDLSGKMLMQQQFNKADAATLYKSFNLAQLPAGIYLVKVLIGNEVNEISKIVKK